MKKQDIFFILGVLIFFTPFFTFDSVYDFYKSFNKEHGMIMSFIKFFFLATLGEVIALRMKTGKYSKKGFGLLPRAFVWGLIGLTIKMMFIIFISGTPIFLEYMGISNATEIIKSEFSYKKILIAFVISLSINTVYAPVMMTFHKISDMHIVANNGSFIQFFSLIKIQEHIKNIDWNIQWGFVFKKTIPFFWIPAHTITFMLPSEFQVLFAALLGIALGVILSFASLKSEN